MIKNRRCDSSIFRHPIYNGGCWWSNGCERDVNSCDPPPEWKVEWGKLCRFMRLPKEPFWQRRICFVRAQWPTRTETTWSSRHREKIRFRIRRYHVLLSKSTLKTTFNQPNVSHTYHITDQMPYWGICSLFHSFGCAMKRQINSEPPQHHH